MGAKHHHKDYKAAQKFLQAIGVDQELLPDHLKACTKRHLVDAVIKGDDGAKAAIEALIEKGKLLPIRFGKLEIGDWYRNGSDPDAGKWYLVAQAYSEKSKESNRGFREGEMFSMQYKYPTSIVFVDAATYKKRMP